MLLVRNDQGQSAEGYTVGDQCVGTNDQIHRSVSHGGAYFFLFCGGESPGEQTHPDSGPIQQGGQGAVVLLCQHLRWSHQGNLIAGFGGQPCGIGSYCCFT